MEQKTKPIRVLQVIGSMNLGGAESMIMNLYRKIDKTKVQFDFLVHSKEEGAFEHEILQLGGRIFRMQRFRGYNLLNYYESALHFFEAHPEYRVVHGHIGSCAAIYLLAAKKTGCFTIAHSHSASVGRGFHGFLYGLFSFPTRYIADYMFGCSIKAGISRFGKKAVQSNKYRTFYNAIEIEDYSFDLEKRKKTREEFRIKEDSLVIGTIGRISEAKNPELILQMFQKLICIDDAVICLWVGAGELESKYKQAILELGISDKIIMPGFRSDISNIVSALDCFVLPSFFEGLPVVAIEAQAAGLQCLLSDSITKETEVTPLISWLSIKQSPEEWANMSYKLARDNRYSRQQDLDGLRKAGYDINDTSKELMDFYIHHTKESNI